MLGLDLFPFYKVTILEARWCHSSGAILWPLREIAIDHLWTIFTVVEFTLGRYCFTKGHVQLAPLFCTALLVYFYIPSHYPSQSILGILT